MTKSIRKRSLFLCVMLSVLIGCVVGGLLGLSGYESLVESERDEAVNEYFLGIPWLIDSGFRLVRTVVGSLLGAAAGLVIGLLLGRKARREIEADVGSVSGKQPLSDVKG